MANLGLSELAKYGFVELEGTIAKLERLVSLVGDHGRSALAELGLAADPDQALNALILLAETDAPTIKKLLSNAKNAARLIRTLGASSAMVDLLTRRLELMEVLDYKQAKLPTVGELASSFSNSLLAVGSSESNKLWTSIRLNYRRELLRLIAFDVTQESPQQGFETVSRHLSDLATEALQAGLAIARIELVSSKDYGNFSHEEVENTRLAVIAMGKCGARELNYISDVDVIFVADSGSPDLEQARALDVATKLATRMMRALDSTSSEPALWQVDANLRPEGKSGALVRTVDSHLSYYERWAQNWEFQALLKARFAAGDESLAQEYLSKIQPLVWSAAGREGFVQAAQGMRERVLSNIDPQELDRQIKLGPGGLRDIEFTVQLLQLVHGRTDTTVRVQDTISAIGALSEAGYISRKDAEAFFRNYRFLRTLEHRIQFAQMRRTHLMPQVSSHLRGVARGVNLSWNGDDLNVQWVKAKLEVRALHQKVFYRPLLSAVAKLGDEAQLSTEQIVDRLRAIGFSDPNAANTHIQALTSGLSRRAAIQRQLLPVLIEWFANGSNPDGGLLAFRRLSEDLGESHWYLRMLRDSSGAAERLTQVLSSSRLATGLFEKHPEAAAWFEDPKDLVPIELEILQLEMKAIIDRHEDAEKAAVSIRSVRRRETLRVAMGASLGVLSLEEIAKGLSDITESYLLALLELTNKDNLDLGIVAMGRFGGAELVFGSDADLMFVYAAESNSEAQKTAERQISLIRRLAADPVLEFEIDLDLRPEGKNGPIARSLESYATYYEKWANTWEAQALLRARVIAGSQKLRDSFTELIDQYRYPESVEPSALVEIRRIKARVETERLPKAADPKRNLKLGPGAISDVEWLVQLLQLANGSTHPDIRNPKTLESLESCVEAGLIAEHDATVLAEAWQLASRIRSAMVLWDNRRMDQFPTDRNALEGIARLLGYPRGSATALEQDYLAFTRRSRIVFERLFYVK
jgi:glutamate-ammonia-ligase adenylyltransferase